MIKKTTCPYILGIDIGSVTISFALIDKQKRIVGTGYAFHKGQLLENLRQLVSGIDFTGLDALGYTTSGPSLIKGGISVDPQIAFITAARHFHPDAQSLLIIGAEKFGLVTFDPNGEYRNFKSNSSCAAGTGNFLDQQAERLNLPDIMEFSRMAWENKGSFPRIASRCAVFAKTDLIHAQQEGYSLSEICDGLSYGLAKNIVDTVFTNQNISNVVVAGGVALNRAVIHHISKLIHQEITVDDYAHVYGAIGTAIFCLESGKKTEPLLQGMSDFLIGEFRDKTYYYPPLQLKMSDYPDFGSHRKYEFSSARFPAMKNVEVDDYSSSASSEILEVYLGIDIGSTSTKAVLLSLNKVVIAGFYTRTAGRPLQAVQLIFEAIDDYSEKQGVRFIILGSGTTGSGRKFTGKIIGADIIPDEITAHARAAYELDPETDTIIEIGGQDSKFTTLRNGMVTFSVMNNVCAAGTGSFIEEQAVRLGCPMDEYAARVENKSSPMASDRCTVFMERDLNHYLMAGFSTDEIMAAVLHATCENYLTKVAAKGYIGKKIFFQGATAKNKALVAAFEQKLKKPIMVSRYCHLTGALGTALELYDLQVKKTNFRGLDLYRKSIPVRTEVCELCTNHCKLKIAEIDNQVEAYGFLCGRDYNINRYVKNKSIGFHLTRKRNELFRFHPASGKTTLTIGIPACLHLYEDILFWRTFFDLLSIRTISSEDYATAIRDGKNLRSAEFCSPVTAMHGHVNWLIGKADYVFLPAYLDEWGENKSGGQYCYYTQYVSSVIITQSSFNRNKILTPHLSFSFGELPVRLELVRMLGSIGMKDSGIISVTQAWEKAKKKVQTVHEEWKSLYLENVLFTDDIHVILLGRPYTILSPAMNNNIPEIFEQQGVETYYMDMLPDHQTGLSGTDELFKAIQWKFASRILAAAEEVAGTSHCYPVLITSFKCSPDAFVIDYFREILDARQKPYLILQLDEHDSTVGYETRIEAGIRAFRNHHEREKQASSDRIPGNIENQIPLHAAAHPRRKQVWQSTIKTLVGEVSHILSSHSIDFRHFSRLIRQSGIRENQWSGEVIREVKLLKDKTLLLPMWDPFVGPLLEATLQNRGIDARLTGISEESVKRSLSFNTGQCLPLNIIVQNAVDFIEENGLKHNTTALWIPKSNLSCNLSMFPHFTQKLLKNYGRGMEKVSVYTGEIIFFDFSLITAINAYLAYMFGGYIRKIGCSIRPYEKQQGKTDEISRRAMTLLYDAFSNGHPKEIVLEKVIRDFKSIEKEKTQKPKVAIFGDLYVRDNDLFNQELIRTVEANGGEVITTPYSEYMKIMVDPSLKRFLTTGHYSRFILTKFLKSLIPLVEEKYSRYFSGYSGVTKSISFEETEEWLDRFGLNVTYRGESLENLLKIQALIRQHPDLDLFIQTNPSYCCPSLVTEAMTSRIEEITGVPVVTLEYDGTAGFKNENIVPYLQFRKKRNPLLSIS